MQDKQGTPSAHRPHDIYFEQVFKHLPIARQLLEAFLPKQQLGALDLATLELSSESFLTEELREAFADLVYTCRTTGDAPARVCLLREQYGPLPESLAGNVPPPEGKKIKSTFDYRIEGSIEEGRQKGLQQGLKQSVRKVSSKRCQPS